MILDAGMLLGAGWWNASVTSKWLWKHSLYSHLVTNATRQGAMINVYALEGEKRFSFHTLGDLTVRLLNTITSNSILNRERYVIKAHIDFDLMRQKSRVTSQLPALQMWYWRAPPAFFFKMNEELDSYLDYICETSATSAQAEMA